MEFYKGSMEVPCSSIKFHGGFMEVAWSFHEVP